MRRARRRVPWLVGSLAVLGLALLLAAAPHLVAALAERQLRQAGFAEAEIGRVAFGLGTLHLADVRLDAAGRQRVAEIVLRADRAALVRRELASATLSGLRLLAAPGPDGRWHLPGLPLPASSGGPRSPPDLPLGRIIVRDARLTAATPLGPIVLHLSGSLAQAADRSMTGRGAVRLVHDAGGLAGRIDGALGAAGHLTAGLRVTEGALDHPRLRLSVSEGRMVLALGGGAALRAEGRLSADLAAGGRKVALRLAYDGSGPVHRVAAEAHGPGGATASGEARLRLDGTRLEVEDLRLAAADWPLGAAVLRHASLSGRAAGTAQDLDGEISADLSLAGEFPGFAAERVALDFAGPFSLHAGMLTLTPADCLRVSVAGFGAGAFALRRPEALCLKGRRGAPLLMLRLSGPQAGSGRIAAVAAIEALDLLWRGADGAPLVVTGAVPELAGELALAAGGVPEDARLDLSRARLAVAASKLALDDLAAALVWTPAGASRWSLRAQGLGRHLARPAMIAPLRLVATAAQKQDAGPIAFTLAARDESGVLALSASGRHDPHSGSGEAEITLLPLDLAADPRRVGRLFPALAPRIEAAGGQLGGTARLGWGEGDVSGTARLSAADLAFDAGALAVAGLDAALTAREINPLLLPLDQVVTMDLLDIGVPLSEGVVRFGLLPGRELVVREASWRWAGGRLFFLPFRAHLGAGPIALVLRVEGVDLAAAVAAAKIEGLAVTGRIGGQVPLRLADGRLTIEEGELTARDGRIAYAPQSPPAALAQSGPAEIALAALRDFRYDRLALGLDGEIGGEMRAVLALEGHNPDFYDGHPVNFTLNLSGALATILRRSLHAYRLPDVMLRGLDDMKQETP